jgi:hypothetical protein
VGELYGIQCFCLRRRKGEGHLSCPGAEPVWWAAAFGSCHYCSVRKRMKDQGKERGWLGGPKVKWATKATNCWVGLEKGSNGLY